MEIQQEAHEQGREEGLEMGHLINVDEMGMQGRGWYQMFKKDFCV